MENKYFIIKGSCGFIGDVYQAFQGVSQEKAEEQLKSIQTANLSLLSLSGRTISRNWKSSTRKESMFPKGTFPKGTFPKTLFSKTLLAIGLCSAISLAHPGHRPPPRKTPPVRPHHIVRPVPGPTAETVFSFKYSLKAHGIQCKVVESVKAVETENGILTITVKCAF
jgi:hypothetical protein